MDATRVPVLIASLTLAGLALHCAPTSRDEKEIRLKLGDVPLSDEQPRFMLQLRLSDDPFFAEHRDDLDQIEEVLLEIGVSRNESTRLRIGIWVDREPVSNLCEATKIADYNLRAGELAPEGTPVRVFNELTLRNLLRTGDEFYLFLEGEAERLDVTVSQLSLVIFASFIN